MARPLGLFKILLFYISLLNISLIRAIDENDFRFILFKDIAKESNKFSQHDIVDYSKILFDHPRDQIIVGASDYLLRLSLSNLSLIQFTSIKPEYESYQNCINKGQSEESCKNHVRVLLELEDGESLLVCGTNAYYPKCCVRKISDLEKSSSCTRAVGVCPYSPFANSTSILVSETVFHNRDGFASNRDQLSMTRNRFDNRDDEKNVNVLGKQVLYAGATMDFSGQDAAIYRTDLVNGKSGFLPSLRTHQYDPHWLNDPQFVGSFEDDSYVYFLFREVAVEYINCGKVIYSRIARVCKSDAGGQSMMKHNWTSFLKARLNCSRPSEHPFYFNEIQDMAYDKQERVVYAVFTTPVNSIAGSAICSFNISSIEKSFSGAYKHQATPTSQWEAKVDEHHECGSSKVPRYQLMDQPVQPTQKNPLHQVELERYTNIVIDKVDTKHHTGVRVIFVSNDQNEIKKISILSRTGEACVIEVFRLEEKHGVVGGIREMEFDKYMNSLYVLTKTSVWRVPVEHCTRLKTEKSCLDAMNPYCGWDRTAYSESGIREGACTKAPDSEPLNRSWKQNPIECPHDTKRQQPQWSEWSDWTRCAQAPENNINLNDFDDSQQDWCLCQTRTCLGTTTSKSGSTPTECRGPSTRITNCTRHGAWTAWSPWSACSQTCGVAVKTRRRSCSAPAPAHGGRVCVGAESHEIYCADNPPCPTESPHFEESKSDIDDEVDEAIGGESSWSSWSSWSSCSAQCSGGFRLRRRVCSSSSSQSLPGLVRKTHQHHYAQPSPNHHARSHAHARAQTHAHTLPRTHSRSRAEDGEQGRAKDDDGGRIRRRRRRSTTDVELGYVDIDRRDVPERSFNADFGRWSGGDTDSGDGDTNRNNFASKPDNSNAINDGGVNSNNFFDAKHNYNDYGNAFGIGSVYDNLYNYDTIHSSIDHEFDRRRYHGNSEKNQHGNLDKNEYTTEHDISNSKFQPASGTKFFASYGQSIVRRTDSEFRRRLHDNVDIDEYRKIDQNIDSTDSSDSHIQHSTQRKHSKLDAQFDANSKRNNFNARERQHDYFNFDKNGEINQNIDSADSGDSHFQSTTRDNLISESGRKHKYRYLNKNTNVDKNKNPNAHGDFNNKYIAHIKSGKHGESDTNARRRQYEHLNIDKNIETDEDIEFNKYSNSRMNSRLDNRNRNNGVGYNDNVNKIYHDYEFENKEQNISYYNKIRSKRSFMDDDDESFHRDKRHKQIGKSTCIGSDVEYEMCNEKACPMHRKYSAWTEWFPVRNESGAIHHLHRFRYMCMAPVSTASRIKFSVREERRVRDISDSLTFDEEDYLVSEVEHEPEFESKSNKDVLITERKKDSEEKECDDNISVIRASAMIVALASAGAFLLGATCTGGIILYKLRRGGLDFYSKKRIRVPSSPHYVTQQASKQNSYVSVPLRDMSVKRQSSFSGRSNALHKTNNISSNQCVTPKLYPKAICSDINTTLKRGSTNSDNVMNNRDQDKFY